MTIQKNGFFTDNQVLFIGVSSNPRSFSRSVYKDFIRSGIKVIPVNKRKFALDGQVNFQSVQDIHQIPSCAYILLNQENTKEAVESLIGRGVKKILFHSRKTVDEHTLSLCKSHGIESVIACPKMMINSLPIHKIHGFFAGVR